MPSTQICDMITKPGIIWSVSSYLQNLKFNLIKDYNATL